MVNIVICENDKNDQEFVKDKVVEILDDLDIEYEIKVYNSGDDLLEGYDKYTDIILLDIQMDGLDGMETARKIREFDDNVEIIFITSFVEYALEGYEVNAYRYLLKPVKDENLMTSLINCLNDRNFVKRSIVIKEGDTRIKISLKDIMYIEVQGNDITVHTLKDTYRTKGTMSNFETEINSDMFVRCHKSYLVNLEYIKSIKRYTSILVNDEEVPLSRNKYKEIKDRFFEMIEDKLC
ncbi:LytR/AlgR family response regulator transcription factor [Peptacetobacter sp.]|uniref:LytR/AlgR family response regulator transcription factor n=1 Tax=Peptacetobacter sp. TaxID=2991975 RepID=UPI002E765F5B|nr:LytTR family DNA-binding domain-containing protein [Peptacetobacter sp.]MEE0451426.1 LytTR family DNA-binding domain-containing protein [Peptacetobacter sp.]